MQNRLCIAFSGPRRIASGALADVALQVKRLLDRESWAQVLIFDDLTAEPIEVDFRGTAQEVAKRITVPAPKEDEANVQPAEPRRPGRPRLGVVAREVTLLPRHWEWLAEQPGGASVALRKLVEQARKEETGKDQRRRALEAAYRFISAMAGNAEGYEEAIRALFAGNKEHFAHHSRAWPPDVRSHARALAARAFVDIS
jgi:hypothetical protein